MDNSYTILNNTILYIGFNQNSSCFCIGTDEGFSIYKSSPLNDHYTRQLEGGIGIISMIGNSNIIALVGGGKHPFAALNKLILWNDATSKILCEITQEFRIIDIKIKNSLIAIIGKKKINIYYYDSLKNIVNYQNIDNIETPVNKKGIFGINLDSKIHIISYLSNNIGEIIIRIYDEIKNDKKINYKTKKIAAHQSEIAYMCLNHKGDLLASCSEKGTIIRLFSTKKEQIIKELRRGNDYAEIYSLNFDKYSQYLICGSSKGTIHIFNIKENEGVKNPKSYFSSIGSYLNIKNDYLTNEWSFAQCHIDSKGKNLSNFVGEDNTFVVITSNGMYYRGNFLPSKGGECEILQKKDYLDRNEDDDFLF